MHALLTSILILAAVSGQTPPATRPASASQTPPATQTPPAAPPAQIVTRPAPLAMTVHVTDVTGAPVAGVAVSATGPVTREGVTALDGAVKFATIRTGGYRLRFAREGFITLERDVTVRAGQSAQIDVTLSAAPPPPPPPAPPEPVKPPAPEPAPQPPPPIGEPKTVSVPAFVELNFIGGRAARKDSRLACVGTGAATLLQLREALVEQLHDATDEWLYVVAGEGALRVNDKEERLSAGTFSVVPRTMKHAIVPRGRNPLILISILTGEACQGEM